MVKKAHEKKPDPFSQHVWYYLAIRRWHASYSGPQWERTDLPHDDWRGKWIEHRYELGHPDYLSLDLIVEPYRQTLRVNKRDFDSLEFDVTSSAEPHGGLFQISPDRALRGWMRLPISGVQALLTLLVAGRPIILEVHGSAFKRGTALIHTTSGWSTEGHPRVEDEFA